MKISMDARIVEGFERVREELAGDLAAGNLHAANIIRRSAVDSMRQAPKYEASAPGTPPNRHTGKLARSVRTREFADGSAEVATDLWYARIMEYGAGRIKQRAFLAPAVEREIDRLPVTYEIVINGRAS